MNGLGFTLVEKNNSYYIQYNYKGYKNGFEVSSEYLEDIEKTITYKDDNNEEHSYIKIIKQMKYEDTLDNDGNLINRKYLVEDLIQDILDTTLNSQEYILWGINNFFKYSPELIQEKDALDVNNEKIGTQWDYSDNIFVYDNYETFKARGIKYLNANITNEQLKSIINTELENLDENTEINFQYYVNGEITNKVECIKEIFDNFKIKPTSFQIFDDYKTLPDGKIVFKL